MPIVFACAAGHAPGIRAWPEAAPAAQRDRIYEGFERLRIELEASRPEALIVLTSEHWANFFLDHMSAFCIGRADEFAGPVEPWLKIPPANIPGHPELAAVLLERCYAAGIEPAFAEELRFDHGTMVPLSFLTPSMNLPVVPVIFNTLAPPFPTAARAAALGRVAGELARSSPRRIGMVATGGLSHAPGEVTHGTIDTEFDRQFLDVMCAGDVAAVLGYDADRLKGAGSGAVELLSWIALAGALGSFSGRVVAYEPVVPWATGIGLMSFEPHEAGTGARIEV
jgi:aromatic ring-opening dioxygenase catalytic subunit (LigB family)